MADRKLECEVEREDDTEVFSFLKGLQVGADYKPSQLDIYSGNPLIEAMPLIQSEDDFLKGMASHLPVYDEAQRTLSPDLRYQQARIIYSVFLPLSFTLQLDRCVSSTIRHGYIARNPFPPKGVIRATPGFSFAYFGRSGLGKSWTLENLLVRTPQVIWHSKYKDQKFKKAQIVWLKVDCPHDGSTRGLCSSLLMAIGQLVKEDYAKKYNAKRGATHSLVPALAEITAKHKLGLLVVDEIQNLGRLKGGGRDVMLAFFTNLVNMLGLPVVLIGTPAAIPVLSGEFRQARRSTGYPRQQWTPFEQDDPDWKLLLDGIWKYQYTKKPCPLTDDLRDVIFRKTQGIPDLFVKLYFLVQERAILDGTEEITPDVVEEVAKDAFVLVAAKLNAPSSKNGTKSEDSSDREGVGPKNQAEYTSTEESAPSDQSPNGSASKKATTAKAADPLTQMVKEKQGSKGSAYEVLKLAGVVKDPLHPNA